MAKLWERLSKVLLHQESRDQWQEWSVACRRGKAAVVVVEDGAACGSCRDG